MANTNEVGKQTASFPPRVAPGNQDFASRDVSILAGGAGVEIRIDSPVPVSDGDQAVTWTT